MLTSTQSGPHEVPGGERPKQFIEIVFPDHISPGDLEIVKEATYDEPGRARLGLCRIERESRVLSHNGGGLIGVVAGAEFMLPPFNFAYWLEKENQNGHN